MIEIFLLLVLSLMVGVLARKYTFKTSTLLVAFIAIFILSLYIL